MSKHKMVPATHGHAQKLKCTLKGILTCHLNLSFEKELGKVPVILF